MPHAEAAELRGLRLPDFQGVCRGSVVALGTGIQPGGYQPVPVTPKPRCRGSPGATAVPMSLHGFRRLQQPQARRGSSFHFSSLS